MPKISLSPIGLGLGEGEKHGFGVKPVAQMEFLSYIHNRGGMVSRSCWRGYWSPAPNSPVSPARLTPGDSGANQVENCQQARGVEVRAWQPRSTVSAMLNPCGGMEPNVCRHRSGLRNFIAICLGLRTKAAKGNPCGVKRKPKGTTPMPRLLFNSTGEGVGGGVCSCLS